MHILKIIHGYPPNYNTGSEVYSQSICNELSKTNKVSVFTREENPYAKDFTIRKEIKNENLTFYYANNPQGKDGYRHSELDLNFPASQNLPTLSYLIHNLNLKIFCKVRRHYAALFVCTRTFRVAEITLYQTRVFFTLICIFKYLHCSQKNIVQVP
ncbi:hypothetical protein [Flavobacterium sp.]|uniref:hypothetical protein n=1 Tax=Flavobacterium sp. TaxID=239 RepID=UPI00375165DD